MISRRVELRPLRKVVRYIGGSDMLHDECPPRKEKKP